MKKLVLSFIITLVVLFSSCSQGPSDDIIYSADFSDKEYNVVVDIMKISSSIEKNADTYKPSLITNDYNNFLEYIDGIKNSNYKEDAECIEKNSSTYEDIRWQFHTGGSDGSADLKYFDIDIDDTIKYPNSGISGICEEEVYYFKDGKPVIAKDYVSDDPEHRDYQSHIKQIVDLNIKYNTDPKSDIDGNYHFVFNVNMVADDYDQILSADGYITINNTTVKVTKELIDKINTLVRQ